MCYYMQQLCNMREMEDLLWSAYLNGRQCVFHYPTEEKMAVASLTFCAQSKSQKHQDNIASTMICSTGHEKSIKTFCLWICIINLFFFHRQSSLLRSMKRCTFTLICRAWMKSSHFRMKGKEADTEAEVMSTARAWRCALQHLCQVLSWRCVLI